MREEEHRLVHRASSSSGQLLGMGVGVRRAAMRSVRQMVFAPDKQTTTQDFTVTFQLR
jgi:hypothetical protein